MKKKSLTSHHNLPSSQAPCLKKFYYRVESVDKVLTRHPATIHALEYGDSNKRPHEEEKKELWDDFD